MKQNNCELINHFSSFMFRQIKRLNSKIKFINQLIISDKRGLEICSDGYR